MEKMLANTLADFEMKVEKAVLGPLNKLSEVRLTPSTHVDRAPIKRDVFLFVFFGVRRICRRFSETRSSLLNSPLIGTVQK